MLNASVRTRKVVSSRHNNMIAVDGHNCINFCSNDYLGFACDERVKSAFIAGVQEYGFGSGGSALVSGYFKPHQQLEEEMAQFLGRERAVYFNSGYQANLGVMQSLTTRADTIISDRLCHASTIDGITLSRAKHQRYQHNSPTHLDKVLESTTGNKVVVTEGVFSVEGDISKLDLIAQACKQHSALLVVDDAHGVGVFGKGICSYYNLMPEDVQCLVVPLGKAFCSVGAIVSGSTQVIEPLVQRARPYIYTTALPPAVALATIEVLKLIESEVERRANLHSLIAYFTAEAVSSSLPLVSLDPTPIRSILIHDNLLALNLQSYLLEKGFYVACIRPPTVPLKSARIRITLNCNHTKQHILQLLDHIHAYLRNSPEL
jgi:8-amino-7-oxononanoate synthase